jgi:hypothetical protein
MVAIATAFALPVVLAGDHPPAGDTKALERGRELCSHFYAGQLEELHGMFSKEMKEALPFERFKAFRGRMSQELGSESEIVDERPRTVDVPGKGLVTEYVRLARFEKRPEIVEVLWAWGPDLAILGFQVSPAKTPHPSAYLDYQTKTVLRLPFRGEWFVFSGGRTVSENPHALARDQRFSIDLVMLENKSSHSGDGRKNEDYYCFGVPILAPADARVVAASDTVKDNVPGVLNAAEPLGNHVILDHGNGEYSFLAHLKRGSVLVKAGDPVKAGQPLAACGNSGHSSEPHLHVHLQTTATPFDGDGLPAAFERFVANGAPVPRGELVRGMTVRPE